MSENKRFGITLGLLLLVATQAGAQHEIKTYQVTCHRGGEFFAIAHYFTIDGELSALGALRTSSSQQFASVHVMRDGPDIRFDYDQRADRRFDSAIVTGPSGSTLRDFRSGSAVETPITCSVPKLIPNPTSPA